MENEKNEKMEKNVKSLEKLSSESLDSRIQKFEEMKKKYYDEIIGKEKIGKPIKITLPDGSIVEGKSYETRPIDIANGISKGLAQRCIACKVNEKIWDIGRVLEGDCSLQLLKFDAKESEHIFWHSASHILGEALEKVYGVLLCNGPPVAEGFYYDSFLENFAVAEKELGELEKVCKKIVKEKQVFDRIEVSKEDALEMFAYNPFKCENLREKVKDDERVSVYRCGSLIDPCTGPHVLHTGKIVAYHVSKNSSAYWKADEDREVLQRVYGIAYPNKKMLQEYIKRMEEIKKRSHKFIGKQQKLWFMHPYAPGMFFFQPRGAKIYNNLVEYMREMQRDRGYVEVHTPNMYHHDLFVKSGHWGNYKENMFILKVDNCEHALKPMNCPGHCVVFLSEARTYRELPIRMAEYGVLHRNEKRGALTGMTRVRRFVQDDAHIFCREDQIEQEVMGCLEFMDSIYSVLDFKVKLMLATRPEKKCIGSKELWKKAEGQMEKCLKMFLKDKGGSYELDAGGGAFYGPKIDIYIEDSMKRIHQTATVQLDFNLPERFKLEFQNNLSKGERPVMVHRAIYGSLERFLSILTEHCGGKWPFWVSPRQVIVLPVSKKFKEYAQELGKLFYKAGISCDVDLSNKKIQKKIFQAQKDQYNYMLIVGGREVEARSANVRVRDGSKPLGMKKVDWLLDFFKRLLKEKPFQDPVNFDEMKEEKDDEEENEKNEKKED